MSKKQRNLLIRIVVAAALFMMGNFAPIDAHAGLILQVAAYLIVGYDIIIGALSHIGHGQVFDENFLMTIATVGAFATNEISEAVMVMLLFQVGEWFQRYAVGKSRESITELMEIRPDYANVLRDGEIQVIDPEDVEIGETIVVKAGEKVPIDGVVIKGESYVDTSALTGESVPRKIAEGDEILSGYINDNGLLEIKTTKEFDESTVSKILELVEDASSRKAKAENFITKFAKYYTPLVVFGALAIAFLPTLLGSTLGLSEWIIRACTFLVISCPCALVISVPLGFFGGIGGAAREGILIKGSNYIETLATLQTVVFDKTGTLTEGKFEVREISCSDGVCDLDLLKLAATAESYSNHPVACSLRDAYGCETDKNQIENIDEIKGRGIKAKIEGSEVLVGNEKLMAENHIVYPKVDSVGTLIYVAKEGELQGYILIADEVKANVSESLVKLKAKGIRKAYMLTGDRNNIAEEVANKIGIDEVFGELLPKDKVDKVEEILNDRTRKGTLAFVGDGINDAPVLMRADVGIAMGGLGSDAAIEAADVVIMDDEPAKIAEAISISKKTINIVKENIIFALGVKFLFLALGALGMIELWQAVFADVGVAFIAILNSMRALNVKAEQ